MLEYRLEEGYKPRIQASDSNLNDFFCKKINCKEETGLYKFSTGKAFKLKLVQNFVLKVYIVITSKVFANFRFESPISIDFQSEILAFLPPKSAKTFHESLQILSPRKSARTFRITPEFRFESLYLSDFQSESLQRLWR